MASPVVAASADPPHTSNLPPHQHPATKDARLSDNHDIEFADEPGRSPDSLSRDAIREGKQKAKAVMAASGVTVAPAAQSISPSAPDEVAEIGTSKTNGISTSRKRSRSGSRRPSQPIKSEDGQRSAEDEYGKYMLERYRERDQAHEASMVEADMQRGELYNTLRDRMAIYESIHKDRLHNAAAIYGYGYAGFGNGHTNNAHHQFQLVYPAARKRTGRRRARRFHIPRTDVNNQADQVEELVPLRLDIEHDKIKLRDSFTWNLQDRVTSIEAFAETLVEDFNIPLEHVQFVTQQVNLKIQEQLREYYPHVYIKEEPLDTNLPYSSYQNDEMRILVKLNITIGPHTLVDQFEWDINNPANSPEQFAIAMTRDLSLSGEFATAIAHQIREQSQMFTKSLYITAHPFDGRPIEDADVRDNFLPTPMHNTFRPFQTAKEYSPYLWELNDSDLQREELSILREQRRQKRSVTRRGGPALPDLKDRERTVRTLVVSSVLPGASETLEGARVFKLLRAPGRGRRAARIDGAGAGGDDSDDSDTEESEMEEVAQLQITGGTARTRGMRGAAIAAQGAMKASLGRSATPELASLHHHETRHTSRRLGHDIAEETAGEVTELIIKLRIPKERYRQWWRDYQTQSKREHQQAAHLPTPLTTAQASPPRQPSLSGPSSMPPPVAQPRATPAPSVQGTSEFEPGASSTDANGQPWQYHPDGKVDMPLIIPSGIVPLPPTWLLESLRDLRIKRPHDKFMAVMRPSSVARDSKDMALETNREGFHWVPRIKCFDCPKFYQALPETAAQNFEIHLTNRKHVKEAGDRRAREARERKASAQQS